MPNRLIAASTRVDIALGILRAVTGAVFIAHGAQKLFVFGFAGVSSAFGQMGVPFADITGPAVALLEFFGGMALVLGLLARPVALGLAATMIGAIVMVHLPNGFFNPAGIEFPLAMLGMTVALAIAGAGKYSLDRVVTSRRGRSPVLPVDVLQRAA